MYFIMNGLQCTGMYITWIPGSLGLYIDPALHGELRHNWLLLGWFWGFSSLFFSQPLSSFAWINNFKLVICFLPCHDLSFDNCLLWVCACLHHGPQDVSEEAVVLRGFASALGKFASTLKSVNFLTCYLIMKQQQQNKTFSFKYYEVLVGLLCMFLV